MTEFNDKQLKQTLLKLEEISSVLTAGEKQDVFREIIRRLVPHIGRDPAQLVLAEVLVSLKLEGIIGRGVGDEDMDMVRAVKNAILRDPVKMNQAIEMVESHLE